MAKLHLNKGYIQAKNEIFIKKKKKKSPHFF